MTTPLDSSGPEIQPALTPAEWKDVDLVLTFAGIGQHDREPAALARVIAAANASLPDSDPRKIQRHQVNALRFAVRALRDQGDALLSAGISPGISNSQAKSVAQLADALESYLPPSEG